MANASVAFTFAKIWVDFRLCDLFVALSMIYKA